MPLPRRAPCSGGTTTCRRRGATPSSCWARCATSRPRVCACTGRGRPGEGRLNGYLEDYAAVALGLLALYQVTFELRWLQAAICLADEILDRFHDPENGGFFQTAADHEKLVARRKDFVDSAVPAGNSLAADLLLRLAKLLDRPAYVDAAAGALSLMAEGMGEQPLAFGRLLSALDFYVHPGFEIAIMGEPGAGAASSWPRSGGGSCPRAWWQAGCLTERQRSRWLCWRTGRSATGSRRRTCAGTMRATYP